MMRTLVISLLSIGALVTSINVSANENEPIQPIKAVKPSNPELVELGKMLFFDPRLSKSGWISCNSCHNLSMGVLTIYQHLSVMHGNKVQLMHLPY